MLSWWWALPLSVAAIGAAVLSALAARLRGEATAVKKAAAELQATAVRGSAPAGSR